MILGLKRFDLARFGSGNSCTFVRRKARAVYILLKICEKGHIYLRILKLFRNFALSFDKTDIFETYQRINLIDKSGRFISSQGR